MRIDETEMTAVLRFTARLTQFFSDRIREILPYRSQQSLAPLLRLLHKGYNTVTEGREYLLHELLPNHVSIVGMQLIREAHLDAIEAKRQMIQLMSAPTDQTPAVPEQEPRVQEE